MNIANTGFKADALTVILIIVTITLTLGAVLREFSPSCDFSLPSALGFTMMEFLATDDEIEKQLEIHKKSIGEIYVDMSRMRK